jgi:hypothetical protein
MEAARLEGVDRWTEMVRQYKVALRAIVGGSADKSIAAILPPGCLVANSALVEAEPNVRPTARALAMLALLNSTPFNWLLGFSADLNVNLFALKYVPVPDSGLFLRSSFLPHTALRLSANHSGYSRLWHEQLGSEWREPEQKHTWPVLARPEARYSARAALDAVIADAYGLTRTQYAHVLGAAKATTFPNASELCLAAFEELHTLGLEDFAKKYDPYGEVPLVEALPPVPD